MHLQTIYIIICFDAIIVQCTSLPAPLYVTIVQCKRVVPHPTEEIGMDYFLGFEVNQRLARRGSSHQCHHIWASQTLLPLLSTGTLLSEQHSCSLGRNKCRILSDIPLYSTPLLVLVVTSSCEAEVTSAPRRKGCYHCLLLHQKNLASIVRKCMHRHRNRIHSPAVVAGHQHCSQTSIQLFHHPERDQFPLATSTYFALQLREQA